MSTPTFNASMALQNEMAKKVILENSRKNKTYICGVDVAYDNNIAYCSAVKMSKDSMEVMHSINLILKIKYHYAPSFFKLRESEPIR
jgi:deoxyinosine 3'endonuclease (endonuclease V)